MSVTYLGKSEDFLHSSGAFHTAKEISGQPDLWYKTYTRVRESKAGIQRFLQKCFKKEKLEIILTGAGTSAFIGDVVEGPCQQKMSMNIRAVATTDLVTHADQYFFKDKPLLLISFARSGDSPESVAAINLADQICSEINHLIITCNPTGALASQCKRENCLVFLLPPEADDLSLAMTGSFTSMLLSCLLFSEIEHIDDMEAVVKQLHSYGTMILENYLDSLSRIARLPFNRAVFLGSGPMQGIACESHLKLQELTDGKVICKYDSFLGFRHGPKAVIDDATLLVFLFSNKDYVHQYERDLVDDINKGHSGLARIGIGESISNMNNLDLSISFDKEERCLPEEYLAIADILPAQILGFMKSLDLGLKPDTPSASGTITRVVQGVKIYSQSEHTFGHLKD
jgi:tagatose-6-phosphate ketose/aldose isomerase